MQHFCVIETKKNLLPRVKKQLGNLTYEQAKIEFASFVMDNMKNLGYSYFDKLTKGIIFEKEGFYSNTEKFVPCLPEQLEIIFGDFNYKLD
jgi:hypothetical protein